MGTALQYPGNIVAGTLTSMIPSSGTGTFTASGFPTTIGDGSGRPFVVEVGPGLADDEKILITSYASGVFTPSSSPLGRGWDLTSPIAHQAGEIIKLVPDATSIQDFGDHVYKTTRDDHPQYARTDGTRAITGAQAFNNGLSVAAGGVTVTAGGLTVVSGTAAVQALTAASLVSAGAISGTNITASAVAQAQAFLANLTGTAGRYVGSTAAGAPSSGTFLAGDFVVDAVGNRYTCIVGGTPGTWTGAVGGQVASFNGPGSPVNATNTTTTVATFNASLLAGQIYRLTVFGVISVTSGSPIFANISVTDSASLIVGSALVSSQNSPPQTSAIPGTLSHRLAPVSNVTDTFTITLQDQGASTTSQVPANGIDATVVRVA